MKTHQTPSPNRSPVHTAPITLTDAAAAQLTEVLQKEGTPRAAIRLSVQPGCCSDYSYLMSFDSNRTQKDLVFTSQGHTLLCDPDSFQVLQGLEIDFSNDLMSGGFKFRNPNATQSCGCGSSFSA